MKIFIYLFILSCNYVKYRYTLWVKTKYKPKEIKIGKKRLQIFQGQITSSLNIKDCVKFGILANQEFRF